MPADKPRPTLADYVTIAASPALIMAMIVSLVFFLLAIFYRGEYAGRLHYIFFCFIFGIVLVARIAMETGLSERAPLYGLALALLVWLGMGKFVSYPPEIEAVSWLINAGLIGLAWWLSYQLTYSCTYLDEQAESSGTGLLEVVRTGGVEELSQAQANGTSQSASTGKRGKKSRKSWWERFQQFREERKKRQPPGVWVVYFALAALPIFGLGQALIDPADEVRRTRTFWLMALYLASSLGLLGTTAFLGLRRYLRQRRLEMPRRVTAAWLVLGVVLMALLVGIGSLLPRPHAEVSLLTAFRAGSQEREASQESLPEGEPSKGEGRPGGHKSDTSEGGRSGSPQPDDKKATENGQGKDRGGNKAKADADGETAQAEGAEINPFAWLSQAAAVLKWVVFAILLLIIVVLLLIRGLNYLAAFTDWARRLLEGLRRWWDSLWGSRRISSVVPGAVDESSPPKPVPFESFSNPFASGRAQGMTPADLVRYTFEALEAWAAECATGRRSDESPIEFTERLDGEMSLQEKAQGVGLLYARVLYARDELPSAWRETVQRFWKQLDALVAVGERGA